MGNQSTFLMTINQALKLKLFEFKYMKNKSVIYIFATEMIDSFSILQNTGYILVSSG